MGGKPELDELYDASYRRLVVQMYAICGDLAEAEDAVQEAFVTAMRKERELRRVANPEAWVRTAALNRLRTAGGTRRWCGSTSPGCRARRARSRPGPSTSRS